VSGFPRLPRRPTFVLAAAIIGASLSLAHGAGGGAGTAAAPASDVVPTQPQSLLVTTDKGQLEGRTTGLVDQFLGIPYAQPPVGALRWAAPTPVTAWTGVRSALAYGNRCAQLANGNGPRVDAEDCLYLNVFTPVDVPASGKLPVLFMIHGGGLTTGAGDQQDGSLLAQTQHVVVVSVNYRLGPFGFLDLPGLTDGTATAGSFGLLDQEAALRWTAGNIAAFGGDPAHVTVAGESAGGWSVCALLTAPGARGLFARAVMESGSCVSQTPAQAQTASLAFAAKAGCTSAADAAACLRGKPESALLDASSGYGAEFIAGGPDLPVAPANAVAAGQYTKVPILFGDNRDEGRVFAQGFATLTEAQYVSFVDSSYGTLAPQVLQRYPWSAYSSPYTGAYAVGAIFTDSGTVAGIGGCTAQNLAEQFAKTTRTYFFQFDDRNAPGLNNQLPGYQWGAGHAMELAYLWPSFTNGYSLYAELTPAQLQLSREMLDRWGAFVRTGSPNTAGRVTWPVSSGGGRLMSLRSGGRSTVISGAEYGAEHQCGFWDSAGASAEG
jgi:carboxylesterase type B